MERDDGMKKMAVISCDDYIQAGREIPARKCP
jgi:hypothetical protein